MQLRCCKWPAAQAQKRFPLQPALAAAGLVPAAGCVADGHSPASRGAATSCPAPASAGGLGEDPGGRALLAALLTALPEAWLLPGTVPSTPATGLPMVHACGSPEGVAEAGLTEGAVMLAAAAAEALLALLHMGAAAGAPCAMLARAVAALLGPQVAAHSLMLCACTAVLTRNLQHGK